MASLSTYLLNDAVLSSLSLGNLWPTSMAEPINFEFDTICKNKGKIIDLVSGCAGASWFSTGLQQEKFIDDGSNVHTLGLSEKDKVHRMMDSVESKIKYDSKCFDKFIRILRSSTSLQKLAGELVADCGKSCFLNVKGRSTFNKIELMRL